MIVETERLRLRELTEADAPALLALYQHADVSRFMGPPPASLEMEISNIRSHRAQYYAARGYGLWGVQSREDGQLIGRCGLLDVTLRGRSEVELSYLIHPSWWGRGLATEAARAAVAYARVPLEPSTCSCGLRHCRSAPRLDGHSSRAPLHGSIGPMARHHHARRRHARFGPARR